MWINFLFIGLALTLTVLFGEETMYDRDNLDEQPSKPNGLLTYKLHMLTGVYGVKCKGQTTLWQSAKDLAFLLTRPYFNLLCCTISLDYDLPSVFYSMTFMWAIGINQTLVLFLYPTPEAGGYGFSNLVAGIFYIAPIAAVILGEFFGHFFSNSPANVSNKQTTTSPIRILNAITESMSPKCVSG
jgi:hypothetical protein